MPQHWIIEPDRTGLNAGAIVHCTAPRFSACWLTGDDMLADIDGPCWSDAGSGDDDSIQLYGFQWTDPPPGQAVFQTLMDEAVNAIDAWIAERL